MRVRMAIAGAACYLITAGSTVEAAKGVKKVAGGNVHSVSGVVTSITPDKTGYGTFQIRTATHHKKNGVNHVAKVNGANGHHSFNVTSATRFEHHSGGSVSMVNALALQRGQHVRVQTTGQQAQNVHIVTSMRSRGNFTRHRASSYHPHYGHRVQQMHHAHHHRR